MEQRGHIPFRIQVVAPPPTRVIDGSLEVDHDKGGILWQRTGQPAGHALILAAIWVTLVRSAAGGEIALSAACYPECAALQLTILQSARQLTR
jgi:hypothetical protein